MFGKMRHFGGIFKGYVWNIFFTFCAAVEALHTLHIISSLAGRRKVYVRPFRVIVKEVWSKYYWIYLIWLLKQMEILLFIHQLKVWRITKNMFKHLYNLLFMGLGLRAPPPLLLLLPRPQGLLGLSSAKFKAKAKSALIDSLARPSWRGNPVKCSSHVARRGMYLAMLNCFNSY